MPALNLWVEGRRKARIDLQAAAEGLTPYGPLIYPQDRHERLLVKHLEALGVPVLRGTEILSFSDEGDHVSVVLRLSDGREETCQARYLAGCDGAGSTVRQKLGFRFPGGTYQQLFYVADVDAAGPAVDGELHVDLDEADFLAVFPLKGQGRARLVGTVRGERAENARSMRFEDVSLRAIRHLQLEVRRDNWFSTYHVHHRVAEHFRKKRVFLLGDAAHIHSPAGGQGMNTGIGDAVNLAWKLKAVLAGEAPDGLLDTYESERRSFAIRLVATTDRAFTLTTAEGRIADFVRTRIVPAVLPILFSFAAARRYMFRTVSQIGLSYRDSGISQGRAGGVRGGDRLPWVQLPAGDNFDAFRTICWQLHVYGAATGELEDWCTRSRLVLHAFPWQPSFGRSGLVEDAMYLIRPDTYVDWRRATRIPAFSRATSPGTRCRPSPAALAMPFTYESLTLKLGQSCRERPCAKPMKRIDAMKIHASALAMVASKFSNRLPMQLRLCLPLVSGRPPPRRSMSRPDGLARRARHPLHPWQDRPAGTARKVARTGR